MSPVRAAETATSPVPEPAGCALVAVPYAVVIPYSNAYVVAVPAGLTVPDTVAEDAVIAEVPPVVAVGEPAARAFAASEAAATARVRTATTRARDTIINTP